MQQQQPELTTRSNVVSQDLNDLTLDTEWENDNVHLDDALLLAAFAQLSQDVQMLQARIVGSRRSREFTPGSAVQNRTKFLCVEHTPPEILNFSDETASLLNAAADGSHSSSSVEYEDWDVDRDIQARHVSARQRFWQFASEEAKQRMVRELYAQPAGTPATIQARENGWIPM